MPTARFEPSDCNCVRCKKKLKVLKTHTKTAATLEIGLVRIHEKIKHCDNCHEIYRSAEPAKLVACGCRCGFNVLVKVGMSMFVDCQNEKQIQAELKNLNIPISIRQVGYLARKFIVYLALANRESRSKIKDLLCLRGGYILHLDVCRWMRRCMRFIRIKLVSGRRRKTASLAFKWLWMIFMQLVREI